MRYWKPWRKPLFGLVAAIARLHYLLARPLFSALEEENDRACWFWPLVRLLDAIDSVHDAVMIYLYPEDIHLAFPAGPPE